MTALQTQIEDLFNSYHPLQNINSHWSGQKQQNDFRQMVEEQTACLQEPQRQRIIDELFGWGPLEELKTRDDIFDIIIQGSNKIVFETAKGLQTYKDHFLTERSFKNFVERLIQQANIVVDQKEPFANGKIGPFRVHIVVPPASQEITITLRRHNPKVFSFQELIESGFLTENQQPFFQEMIDLRKNFLVIGPTGSGKTTFLNSLINRVARDQRLVLIEDTDELQRHHPLCCKLLSREICPDSLNAFDMGDLVKQALRMRPDRLVIGEVRGPEAKDLLMALATGHAGSMGTLHAESSQQALLRLEMLVQMGAPQWSLESIRRLILMSLDYLVVLKHDRCHKGIKEVCRIRSLESFGLLIEPVRDFDQSSLQL